MSTRTLALSMLSLILIVTLAIAGAPRAEGAGGAGGAGAPAGDDDLAALKTNTEAFAAAWNRHDGKALAAIWAEGGDLIDPWGVTSVGRANVEKFFTEQHTGAGPLAKSTYELKSRSARLITPDVALDDWQVVLTGLADKDGKPMGPMIHRVVIVWKKTAGKWEIAAARPGVPAPPPATSDATTLPKMPDMPSMPSMPKAPTLPSLPKMPGK